MNVHLGAELDPLSKLVNYAIIDAGDQDGRGWARIAPSYIERSTSLTEAVWDLCVDNLMRCGVILDASLRDGDRWYRHASRVGHASRG